MGISCQQRATMLHGHRRDPDIVERDTLAFRFELMDDCSINSGRGVIDIDCFGSINDRFDFNLFLSRSATFARPKEKFSTLTEGR